MRIEIKGKIKGKSRPRFRRIGNYVSTYNTKETIEYENLIRTNAIEQCKELLDSEYSGDVKVSILALFKPNKSLSKKKFEELIGTSVLKKPDFDNIAKAVCDSLNGVAYKDDSQISEFTFKKMYDYEERLIVTIEYLDL